MPTSNVSNMLPMLIFLVVVIPVFYFLSIRPNQKQRRERLQMLHALKKGDRVVTLGGLHGTVVDLTDELVTIANQHGVRLLFDRSAINRILNADGTPKVIDSKKKDEKAEEVLKDEKVVEEASATARGPS